MANFEYVNDYDDSCHTHWAQDPVRTELLQETDVSFDALEEWFARVHTPARICVRIAQKPSLESVFEKLSKQWKDETWHVSSIRRKISHPAYLKVIGMGTAALPLIFNEMRKSPSLWFWALDAITRADIKPDSKSMSELHEAWLRWAEEHGY